MTSTQPGRVGPGFRVAGFPRRRRAAVLAVVAIAVVVVLAVGLALFQPWKLFTHSRIDESLPGVSDATGTASVGPAGDTSASGRPGSAPAAKASPTATSSTSGPRPPVILSKTAFGSGEHRTVGAALLVRVPDGSYVVRLENLSTSDGPDVHVVLSSSPAGSSGVGHYAELGHLKATDGNQNYPVRSGTDLTRFRSIVVWCKRFDAVFGSAGLNVS